MSIPKNQHYVPAFYLKNFRADNSGHIAGYEYELSKLYKLSAIKWAASQENFYGKNSELEKGFAYIESKASKIINKIISTEKINKNDIVSKITLWLYILIQSSRTPKRVAQFPKILKGAAENTKNISKEHAELIKNLKLPSDVIMALTYQNLFLILPDTLDLDIKLVINKSPLPLITSDHPVFSYNQFMEKRVPEYNGNGLLIKGTQIFLPLSPKHLLVFFDRDIYKLFSAKRDVCSTTLIEDIKNINSLSALNANTKIFFSKHEDHKRYDYYADFRNKFLKKTTGSEIPKTGLKLSFFKEIDKARFWTPKGPLSYYRNNEAGLRNLLLG